MAGVAGMAGASRGRKWWWAGMVGGVKKEG